ncbi:hypothetical protein [Curtobacterium caseinilyticum]|uniref:Integral membrane protein n=1 Tax=Curtobacterium caseinilyticum TaxID=3055137 RepID=A0ABT7TQU0_9MICO|nr:hypothetical protein [Curtobacterium caseinilyticum]MDM7891967.1 hypothetical protein [Curtobacterium caseinilyticum]
MHGGERSSAQQVVVGLGVGIGSAVVGLLPWIVTGMRLPLQNTWATPTTDPSDMPIALLPFSQYAVTTIAAVLLVGGAVTGIVVRVLRDRGVLGRSGSLAALGGLVGLQVVAVVETAVVTGAGMRMDGTPGTGGDISASQLYVVALAVGSLVCVAVAAVLAVLIGRAAPGGALVALALAAVALGVWADALVVPPVESVGDGAGAALAVLRWLPAVAVGAAIAWTGLRTIGQGVGAVVALGVLWTGTALITAVSYALGSRVYLPYPVEMVSAGATVFVMALGPAGASLVPVVVAAVVGVLGAVAVRWWARRRHRPEAV